MCIRDRVIGDAGVPIARPEQRVDLALTADVPTIAEVLDLIMDEMIFEKAIVAKEQKLYNPVDVYKRQVKQGWASKPCPAGYRL